MKPLRNILGGLILITSLGYASLSNAQNYQWAKGTTTSLNTGKIVKDNKENIFVSGTYTGDVDMNFSNAASDTAILHGGGSFLVKYNAAGNYKWGHRLGNGGDTLVDIRAVQSDNSGNVYVAGMFTGVMDFNLSTAPADTAIEVSSSSFGGGFYDACMYVAKYDSLGNFIWVMNLSGGSYSDLWNLTVKNGNVYITGGITTYSSAVDGLFNVDFNPSKLASDTFFLPGVPGTNEFELNPFFAVYNSNAQLLTAKRIYGSPEFKGYAIDADASGNIYLCGGLRGTHDLDPSVLPADTFLVSGVNGIFVSSYNSAGMFRWAAPVLGDDNYGFVFPDNPILLKVKSNRVYLSGIFKGQVDFNPGLGIADTAFLNASNGGGGSSYLVSYDTVGNFLTAHTLQASGEGDRMNAMATDDSGNLYIAGEFNGVADFNFSPLPTDTFKLTSSGSGIEPDLFFAKYNSNNALVWARKVGNATSQYLTGMAAGNKSLSVFGRFGGDVVFDPIPPVNNDSKLLGGGTYLANYRTSPPSGAKDIMTYGFSTPSVIGTITSTDSILVTVPTGTSVAGLIANFTISPDAVAHVGNALQLSGTTPNNFGNVVTYTIMAEDSTTKDYHVKVTVLQPNAIDEVDNQNAAFKVWPNPTNSILYFEKSTDVKLYDISGKLVLSAYSVDELSVNHLVPGLYIIENKEGFKRKFSILNH